MERLTELDVANVDKSLLALAVEQSLEDLSKPAFELLYSTLVWSARKTINLQLTS